MIALRLACIASTLLNFPIVCFVFLVFNYPDSLAFPGWGLPSVMLGLVFLLNRLCWLYPSGSCVSISEKLLNFMYFHNYCRRNCDHHILLFKPSDVHKEKILPQIMISTCEGEGIETRSQMVVAFTLTEINY